MSSSDSPFPYVHFLDREVYSDPDQVSEATTNFVNRAIVSSIPPGGAVDLVASALLFPNLSIWHCHFKLAAELRHVGVSAQQFILFPGFGHETVETRNDLLTCDDRFGVNLEAENMVAVRASPGRQGVGLSVDRLTLIRRLAVLLDAPVRRRLSFNTRFDATVGYQSATRDMIGSVLAPTLGRALTASPAMASALSATIFDLVLNSLPHNYCEDLRKPPVRIAPKHVKRAIDYVESNVHSGLTVDDLALACNVSIRAMQYGFRHFLDITPADHIRNVRLERARRDILQSGETPLTEIAARCGALPIWQGSTLDSAWPMARHRRSTAVARTSHDAMDPYGRHQDADR